MIRLFSVFLVFFVVASVSLAQTDLRWDVDTSKNISVPLEIRRGESLNLFPRFLSYSVVTQLTNSASVELWYRSADMSNGLYYAITGAVHNATNGQARIPWSNANCATATNYTYDIVVRTNSVISNLRAFGTIRLLAGVYSQATTLTNPPTAWGLLDWSSISNINLSSAPFPLDSEMASSTSRLASLETGVLGLTNRATSLESGVLGLTNRTTSLESGVLSLTNAVIAGDLAGTNHTISATNALDIALRALIDAVAQAGTNHTISATNLLDIALRAVVAASTQTIAGATVSGTVPAATWSEVSASSTNATSAGYATTAGSAGSADSANYAGYLVGDLGYAFGNVTPSGFYSDDGMGGAQTWYLYGPLRTLSGNWTNTGTLLVQGAQTNEGTLTVLGGGNVLTNNHPGATFSGTTTASNVVALGTVNLAGPVQYGGTNAAPWYITTTNAYLDIGTNRIYLTP